MASRPEKSAEARQQRRDFWDQASHDLRQPVQSLQLLSHVFARAGGDEGGDEAVRQGAGHMRRVVDDLARMHGALLRLMRLECEGSAPARRAVPLGALTKEAVQALADSARQEDVQLRADGIEGSVKAEPETLALILQGLILLALRHCEGDEIGVGGRSGEDEVSITVEFDGAGVPAEERGNVFIDAAGAGGSRTILGPRYLARLCGLLGHGLVLGDGQAGPQRFRLTVPRR